MLQTASEGANKTKLMYRALLSYGQLSAYIKYLEERDLMIFDQKASVYRVTRKGKHFLEVCEELETMIGLDAPNPMAPQSRPVARAKPAAASTIQKLP